MPTAAIIFQQSGDNNLTPGSRDDLILNSAVTILNSDNTGVTSWQWQIIDKPAGSTASLVSPTSSTTTFTPDIVGTYLIKLSLNAGTIHDQKGGAIKTAQLVYRIPAANETIEFDTLRGWATALDDAMKKIDDEFGNVGGGSVVEVDTGAGLTGGPITTTGTILLATSGIVANTYQGITFDIYGRATAASDQSYITQAYTTIQENGSALTQRSILNFSTNFNASDVSSKTFVELATTGITANTYQGITFDQYGRATSASDQSYLTTSSASSTYLAKAGGTMTGSLLFTDNSVDIGASGATRPRTLYLGTSAITPAVSSASGSTLTLTSGQTDSGSAVGIILDTTNSFTTSGDKMVSFRTGNTEYAWFDKFAGSGYSLQFPTGTGASYILHPATLVIGKTDLSTYINIGNGIITLNGDTIRGPGAERMLFQSMQPDSGSNTNAFEFDTNSALTSTRRLVSFKNNTAEKVFIDYFGQIGVPNDAAIGNQAFSAYLFFHTTSDIRIHGTTSPESTAIYDLGTSTLRWGTVYNQGINSLIAGVGTAQTTGILLENTTAAANGAQQYSSTLVLQGEAWSTGAGASKTNKAALQLRTIQGSTSKANLDFLFDFDSTGSFTKTIYLDTNTTSYANWLVPFNDIGLYTTDGGGAFGGLDVQNGQFSIYIGGGLIFNYTSTLFKPFTDNSAACGDNTHQWTAVSAYQHGSKQQNLTYDAAAKTIGVASGQFVKLSATDTGHPVTLGAITLTAGTLDGQPLTLILVQNASGDDVWPTTMTNATFAGGTFAKTTTASAIDVYEMGWDSNSSKWREKSRSINLS